LVPVNALTLLSVPRLQPPLPAAILVWYKRAAEPLPLPLTHVVLLVLQVVQFAEFIRGAACSRCHAPLAFDERKSLQKGVGALWTVACSNKECRSMPLLLNTCRMHEAPWEDEPLLNTKAHYDIHLAAGRSLMP
jgi:hypothetical protein